MQVLLFLLYTCLPSLSAGKIYDLTHVFDNATIYWPNVKVRFTLSNAQRSGNASTKSYYESNVIQAPEHGGTHLDAPLHFHYGAHSVSDIPLETFIGKAFVVDVEKEAGQNRDLLVGINHIEEAERKQGRIPNGSILLVNTGWSKRYNNIEEYLGTATSNTSLLHFPGLDPKAAQWLVDNRKIKLFGIDTASTDYGQSKDFQTHNILSKHNIPGLENLKGVGRLIGKDVTVYALPMYIKKGSGAPLRIIAIENEKTANSANIGVFSMYLMVLGVFVSYFVV